MKRFHVFVFVFVFVFVSSSFAQKTSVTVVSYNCENLFDCRHDTLKNDREFLPEAERHWTRGRYWKKINDIGRVILSCGGEGEEWRLPDIVGLVEVENDSVLLRLVRGSVLREAGYRYVMTNSSDRRGVDVALLYNPFTVRLLASDTLRIMPRKGQRPTRDVLHCTLQLRSDDTLHVFVVHAPSRAGGQGTTDPYRVAVAKKVVGCIDTLPANANIIVLGDFNDYSYNKSLMFLSAHGLTDVSAKAVGRLHPDEVLGTYYFRQVWESLDHIFLSPSLLQHVAEPETRNRKPETRNKKQETRNRKPETYACYIQDIPWMLEKDKKGRLKPFRTYLGTYYHGGGSDHLPLVLHLSLPRP